MATLPTLDGLKDADKGDKLAGLIVLGALALMIALRRGL